MGEFFGRMWEMLMGRGEGPLTFRLILQPTMAAILAIRAGLRDARAGQPAWFLWSLLTDPARRPELLAQVRKDVGKVFLLAVVLDVIYSLDPSGADHHCRHGAGNRAVPAAPRPRHPDRTSLRAPEPARHSGLTRAIILRRAAAGKQAPARRSGPCTPVLRGPAGPLAQ